MWHDCQWLSRNKEGHKHQVEPGAQCVCVCAGGKTSQVRIRWKVRGWGGPQGSHLAESLTSECMHIVCVCGETERSFIC